MTTADPEFLKDLLRKANGDQTKVKDFLQELGLRGPVQKTNNNKESGVLTRISSLDASLWDVLAFVFCFWPHRQVSRHLGLPHHRVGEPAPFQESKCCILCCKRIFWLVFLLGSSGRTNKDMTLIGLFILCRSAFKSISLYLSISLEQFIAIYQVPEFVPVYRNMIFLSSIF